MIDNEHIEIFVLDRSTDKKGGKKSIQRKRLSPTQKYGKLPTFDDQKPIQTENNYRSNPKHKKHKSGLWAQNRNIDRNEFPKSSNPPKFNRIQNQNHQIDDLNQNQNLMNPNLNDDRNLDEYENQGIDKKKTIYPKFLLNQFS
jgi:hypothetical protein